MRNTPLELATTAEIIDELLDRETFAGLIVCSKEENKGQAHGDFCIHSALHIEDATTVLEVVLSSLTQHKERGNDGSKT